MEGFLTHNLYDYFNGNCSDHHGFPFFHPSVFLKVLLPLLIFLLCPLSYLLNVKNPLIQLLQLPRLSKNEFLLLQTTCSQNVATSKPLVVTKVPTMTPAALQSTINSCTFTRNHISKKQVLQSMTISDPLEIDIIRSIAIKVSDMGLSFRSYNYCRLKARFTTNGYDQDIGLDSGCSMTIIDHEFLKEKYPEAKTQRIPIVNIKGIGFQIK